MKAIIILIAIVILIGLGFFSGLLAICKLGGFINSEREV